MSGVSWWVWGDDYCTLLPVGFSPASIRFAGAPDDWRYDTLNLYREESFIGQEEFLYNDKVTDPINDF